MKYTYPILIVFALLSFQTVFAQGWEYTLPDVGTLSRGHDLISTSDGNYLNVGFQSGGTSSDTFGYYALKINDDGDVLWRKNLPSTVVIDTRVIQLSNGKYVFFGSYAELIGPSTFTSSPTLVGIDEVGNKEWEIELNLNVDGNIFDRKAIALDNGSFIFSTRKNNKNLLWNISNDGSVISGDTMSFEAQLAYRKTDGNLVWFESNGNDFEIFLTDVQGNNISSGSNTIQGEAKELLVKDNVFYVTTTEGDNIATSIYQYKIDAGYTILDSDQLYTGQFARFDDMTLDTDGILYAGMTGLNPNPDDATGFAMKTDFEGNVIWSYTVDHVPAATLFSAITPSVNEGYLLSGEFIEGLNKSYIIKLDQNGVLFGSSLSGAIAIDDDENCLVNTGESPIPDWYITAEKNSNEPYLVAISDLVGEYTTTLDTGNYNINLIEDGYYWSVCDNDVAISVPTFSEDINVDFSVEATTDCPQMTVNINTYWSSPCQTQPLFITYKNKGTVTAESAYLEIQLDTAYTAISSGIPWTSISPDNVVRIDLGDVEALDGETFIMEISLSCDAVFGNSYLIDAHAYPDTICGNIPPQYSGAFLQSSAGCNLDSVYFKVKNTGLQPMDLASPFFIVEDAVLMNQGNIPPLNPQEEYEIVLPATGGTFILIHDQVDFAPGFSNPITIVEGCAPGGSSNYSTGYTNQFPLDDEDAFVDIEYVTTTQNPTPNSVLTQPQGYATENYIDVDTRITYQINFQNTTGEEVSKLVVKNELDASLDIGSLRLEGSSHSFRMDFENQNQLVFTFDEINLPTASMNAFESQGIISYSILPKISTANGTEITQSSSLEFDDQTAVELDEVKHTIGDDYIEVDIPSSTATVDNFSKVVVSPNPAIDQINFELINKDGKEYGLEFYNIEGLLVFKEKSFVNRLTIDRKELSSGFYFYKISGPDGLMDSGKVVLR